MKLVEIKELDRLTVYKGETLAGTLTRTLYGSTFEYDEGYLDAGGKEIAFHLSPLQPAHTTRGDNLPPFFAGLLPEGLRLTALVSALKTSADDMFSLLAASGSECIGDVQITIPDNKKNTSKSGGKEVVDFDEVVFSELFERSIHADDYTSRLLDPSIAGVHPKLSAQMISFPVSIAKRRKSYILKLGQKQFPKIVENEHFFMKLAQECGLQVAETSIVTDSEGNAGLLVSRFDRMYDRERKAFQMVHQEDGCQLTDRYPQDKYRLSLREIATAFQSFCTAPVLEVAKLIELVTYSYLIGNGDLHAKNISVITDPTTNRVVLSPCYDLLSTLPYGDQHMALKVEGKDKNIRREHLVQFGTAFGVREVVTHSIIERICEGITQHVGSLSEIGLSGKQAKFLEQEIRERISLLTTAC